MSSHYIREIEELEAEAKRLIIALHDTIRRPMGVVPDSAVEFYDPKLADAAEVERASKSELKAEVKRLTRILEGQDLKRDTLQGDD